MTCPTCNAYVPPDASLCPSCSQPAAADPLPLPTQHSTPPLLSSPGPTQPTRQNTLAVAALAVSIIGLILCQLLSPVGLIMGIVARRQIISRGESGTEIATAAIVVSAIGVAVLLVFSMIWAILVAIPWTSQ